MSPRTGRPKIDNPKNHDIKVRIDTETNEKLLAYAQANGTTRAETIREAIILFLSQQN